MVSLFCRGTNPFRLVMPIGVPLLLFFDLSVCLPDIGSRTSVRNQMFSVSWQGHSQLLPHEKLDWVIAIGQRDGAVC